MVLAECAASLRECALQCLTAILQRALSAIINHRINLPLGV